MLIHKKNKKTALLSLVLLPLLFLSGTTSGQYQTSLDVPFVPTPQEVVEAMLSMAEVGADDTLYDLGCGDGRIVITAAKEYGCRGVGIDLDPVRIRESRANAEAAGVEDKVEFRHMDLFKADFSRATVVTLYLLSSVNLELRPRLLRELKPGTRVVSHDFDMGDWKADKETVIDGDWDTHAVYYWVIPANVTGTWKWTLPGELSRTRFTLKLDQEFQSVNGKFSEGSLGFPASIEEAKIEGASLFLVLERKHRGQVQRLVFEGTTEGHTIRGTVREEGSQKTYQWTARRNPASMGTIDGKITPLF